MAVGMKATGKGDTMRALSNMFSGAFGRLTKRFPAALLMSVFFGLSILMTPPPACAKTNHVIRAMPPGQVILNISATAKRQVKKDLLVAGLDCNAMNSDPRVVQNEINTMMQKALALSKKFTGVETATGSYQVYATIDPKNKKRKWEGRQSLTLKSKDAKDLLELAGKLQQMHFTMSNLVFIIDPQTVADLQDSLMATALKRLQIRADRAAKALGKSKALLREITVQNASIPYPMAVSYDSMRLGSAKMAEPVAKAGKTTISLTVSGRAILE